MRKQKFILVLSGGGAKGAFQAGALKYIHQHGIHVGNKHLPGDRFQFNFIAGVSAGSMNAAMVAMDETEKLEELWLDQIAGKPEMLFSSPLIDLSEGKLALNEKGLQTLLKAELKLHRLLGPLFSKKSRKRFIKKVLSKLLDQKSIADSQPLEFLLDQWIHLEKINETILRVGYVSLDTGLYHSVKHTQLQDSMDLRKAILASATMPGFLNPVEQIFVKTTDQQIDNHRNLVDGGVRNISPLGDIIKDINGQDDAETDYYVVIINNHCDQIKPDAEKRNFLDAAYRSLVEIALNEIFTNDIKEFTRINRFLNSLPDGTTIQNEKTDRPYKVFNYIKIQPGDHIGSSFDYRKSTIQTQFDHGFQRAKEMLTPTPGDSGNGQLAHSESPVSVAIARKPPAPWLV